MPYKRNNSPHWWVSYTDAGGQRVRRSTGTTDRKEAAALEAKWKVEAFKEQHWEQAPPRTFEELMLAYLQATESEKRSADKDRQRTAKLRQQFGGRVMSELRGKDVAAYIAARKRQGIRPSTINRELALLSAAINHANREWEWHLPNVVKGRKLREPEGRVRWISRAEAQALVGAARQTRSECLADFVELALNTGCRKGELLDLAWERVDLHHRLIHLSATDNKSGKRRTVPMNDAARAALIRRARFRAQHCPASPWVFCTRHGRQIKDVKRGFATACQRAGIVDFRMHDLRHTAAAWMVSAGATLAEVRDVLGHSTIAMTERYAHLAPDNARAAVNRLGGLMSQSGHIDFEEPSCAQDETG
jgi:integrase